MAELFSPRRRVFFEPAYPALVATFFVSFFWAGVALAAALQVAVPPDLPSAQSLVDAWGRGNFVMVGAIVVGGLVALAKQGWLSLWLAQRIPASALPYLATVLGVVGMMAAEVVAGGAWQHAAIDGAQSAILAVFGHQVVVEGFRGGREIVPEHPSLVSAKVLGTKP